MNAALVPQTSLGGDLVAHLDAQIASAQRLLDAVLRQGQAIRSRQVEDVLGRIADIQAEMGRRAALEAHLLHLEEAAKRDHRKLGAELDLFHFPPEVGSGLPLYHPKGGLIRKLMEDYSRAEHERAGYEFVFTPHIAKAELFETSGHLGWYADSMYPPMELDEELLEAAGDGVGLGGLRRGARRGGAGGDRIDHRFTPLAISSA